MKESDFTNQFANVVLLAANAQREAAKAALRAIAQLGTLNSSGAASKARQAAVLARDRYTCRYCNVRLISVPVMRAMSVLYDDVFKYQRNWKADETDVAFWRDGASIDHVCPVTKGGTSVAANLVASCWPCNFSKGNLTLHELGRELRPISTNGWDGLSGHLGALVDQMSAPALTAYFREWRRAIEKPEVLSEKG